MGCFQKYKFVKINSKHILKENYFYVIENFDGYQPHKIITEKILYNIGSLEEILEVNPEWITDKKETYYKISFIDGRTYWFSAEHIEMTEL